VHGTSWNRNLCLFHMSVRMVGLDATCNGSHVPVAAVASGDGETHCLKVRSDEVQDGPSCGAKQR